MPETKNDAIPIQNKSKKEKWQEEMSSYEKSKKADSSEDNKIYVVVFFLEKEWYGIKIESVSEIIKLSKIFPIPQTLDYILGVMNLRGEILPVLDLRKLFSTLVSPFTSETRILIVEADDVRLGLLVDGVSEVIEVPMSKIDSPLSTLDRVKTEYIYGEIKIGNTVSQEEGNERFLAMIHLENIIKEAVNKK
ncbi:MAG: chemotaxis protein CheW [bacterium]